MKIKKKHIIIIAIIVNVIILIGFLFIPALTDKSWWWLGIPSIVSGICWIIAVSWIVISMIKGKEPKKEEIPITELEKFAKDYSVMHPDNPDNFIIKKHHNIKVGESGAEKTPILVLEGEGTELKEERYFIINKKNPEEFSFLINPTEEELKERIIQIAESQPRPIITEQVADTDAFGRPTTKIITKTTSKAEMDKKEEEKKAEEESSF